MERKKIVLIVLSIALIYFGYSYWSKVQKDDWLKETPSKRYLEKRENQVWGGVLRGHDAGLFCGTPLYDLADEMSGIYFLRNQGKIARLISELPKEYVNYQEEKFSTTIGHFALSVGDFKTIQLLLDRGLNPNLMDKEGGAIIIDINEHFMSRNPETIETLKYLIKKGGDVNLYSPKASLTTPLIQAAYSCLEKVKILTEAGADPHFIVKDNAGPFRSALSTALLNKKIDIVNYLLFDQKVDFRLYKYPDWSKFHPGEYEILDYLRDMPFELNTKEYKEKMKLVAYLKKQGLDYWKTPIPETIRTNSYYTKEYLSKY